MNKNDMIKYLAIGGGLYLTYWYLTNYGPTGAVSAGHASYWDTWFGSTTTTTTAAGTTAVVPTSAVTQPASVPPPAAAQPVKQPVLTQPANPPASTVSSQVKQQIVAASNAAGANQPGSQIQGGYAVPDIWSYFWQQVTGHTITAQQMAQMFPPGASGSGAPLTVDQFLSALPSAGLSGIGAVVSVPSAPSLPSMSFGGSFRRPGMRGMGGRGPSPVMGGSTIQ